MGWSCTACTFRNLNEGSKSCITCGTKRSKEQSSTIDLTTTAEDKAVEKLPSENTTSFVKKRAASSSQRTLFGGVAEESKVKLTKKTKTTTTTSSSASDPPNQQTSAAGASSRQSTISPNPASAYRPITQDPYSVLQKRSKQVLKDVFGIDKLRNQQPNAVECALQNQSCIVVMATGGGKSLCYQLPALVKGGTSIVISPLIALMKDQVDSLQKKGVAAACISSANGEKENVKIMERLLGRSMSSVTKKTTKQQEPPVFQPLSLVYCTPELLQTTRFQNILQELYKKNQLALAAIDEAHCMSSWGHDFRPAYRKLDFIRRAFPRLPCMALTATATPNVIQDLKQTLHLESSPCHIGSFDRPNIFYKVHYKDYLDATADGGSLGDMARFICKQHKRAATNKASIAGIIYCHKREDTIYLAKEITKRTGIPAAGYHGGLKDAERTKVQSDWTNGNVSIVCATISFGMGIDLDCVRYVIHWSIPKTMSGFYQESGRAGRDGQSSISLVYFAKDDANKFAFLISKREESNRKKNGKGDGSSAQRDEQALQDVVNYCTQAQCRRQYVLRHFGEKETDPKTVCQQSCDFCCNPNRVEKAIQSSVATRAMSFQKKQAAKTKKAAKWDGQWDKPHGDNPSDEWGGGEEDWNVGGLGITSASSNDDRASLPNRGGGGFRTAKSMVDWDQLEKQEAKEMGNQENQPSGFMQFKTSGGETSTKTYKARDIYPEHLRQAINARTETLMASKPKPKETTSAEHAQKAASLQAQLDAIKKQKEALLAKKRSSSTSSSAAAPPPAPPAFTSSRNQASRSRRR